MKSFGVRYNGFSDGITRKRYPGASLCGRDPSELKIPELKQWLACRGAPLKGKKSDLVARFVN